MRVYGNHCNAGTIHRNLQPEHVTAAKTIHRDWAGPLMIRT